MELIQNKIEKFISRYPESYVIGRKTTRIEFDKLDNSIKNKIPNWLLEIYLKFPIADLQIGIPFDFGQEKYKTVKKQDQPLLTIRFFSIKEIEKASLLTHPGTELIKTKLFGQESYLPIGEDLFVTQEEFYISNKKEDPTLMLVYHDMGENRNELLTNADKQLGNFSDVFELGKIKNTDRLFGPKMLKNSVPICFELIEKLENIKKYKTNIKRPESALPLDENMDKIEQELSLFIGTNNCVGTVERLCNMIVDFELSIDNQFKNVLYKFYDYFSLNKQILNEVSNVKK